MTTILAIIFLIFGVCILIVIAHAIDSYNDLWSPEEDMCQNCDIFLSGEYHDIYEGLNSKCEAYMLGTISKCPNYK